jgi:hypothetical protein
MSYLRTFAATAGLALAVSVPLFSLAPQGLYAQAAPHAAGTVKTIAGNTMTVAPDGGAPVTVHLSPDTRVLVIPPGTKTLAGATPAAIADITVGDRALVNGKAGDTESALNATRVILIKSTALAARNEQEQADWQRRGMGGLVKSIDGPVITVASGARTIKVDTSATTQFRRFAEDSVRFQDSKASSLGDIHVGDQLQARGNKSDDGLTVTAEEVVTGSFDNLSGLIASVNAASSTLTLQDLATKKTFTVNFTSNSQLRKLPPEAAAMLAARNRPAGTEGEAAATPGAAAPARPQGQYGSGGAGGGQGRPYAGGGRRGGDLSQMLARFPLETLEDLKKGDAVLIVASQGATPNTVTAITLLSGVEALLTAAPGEQPFTLAPWTLSAPDSGGGPAPQ